MDVLDVIKGEHRAVSALIDEADHCEPGDPRLRDLAEQIRHELELHVAVEEKLFYAPLKKRSDEDELVDMFEAYTEHEVAGHLLTLLRGRIPEEEFKARLQVLGESVKHHVEEEESKVFSIAKEMMDEDERDQIGAAWARTKQRMESAGTGTARKKSTAKKSSAKKSTSKKSTSRKTAAKKGGRSTAKRRR